MSKSSQNKHNIATKRITAEQTIIIIRLIKKYKCIWDKKHPDFRKRQVRYNTFKKIGSYFQLTPEDVSRKYRRYRDCYIQELKHLQEKKKSYTSVFYFDEMDFLRDQVKHRSLTNKDTKYSIACSDGVNSGDKSDTDEDLPVESLEDEFTLEEPMEEFQFSSNESDNSKEEEEEAPAIEQPIKIKEEVVNEEMVRNEETTINDDNDPIEEIREENEMKTLAKNDKTDEFDVFAGYLASQLRTMDKLSALETMEELQGVIFKRRIEILKRDRKSN
ncbi:uncharacterized protein LOC129914439 [Episyrphus balteatus]|uniref:uncharacterized protein LOC129914439 n=1 Tax=Episyrphus balteatus TaxID=286459 RepID=UPI0024865EF2|nr:uncharacterized protein LOC129914439 [Episyrphus balteatus]